MNYYFDLKDKRLCYLKDKFKSYGLEVVDFYNNINTVKSGDVIVLSPSYKISLEEAKLLPENIKLFLFKTTSEVAEVLNKKDIEQINFMKDEPFVLKNADLTAECVLCELLTKTEFSLYSMNILILGGGRVAKALGKIFDKLGLNFNFTTIDRSELKNNETFYNKYIEWSTFKDNLKNYNVVINTIPAQLFNSDDEDKFYNGCYVFEIATQHCLEKADYSNFNYVLCPTLPSKYLPKSAGDILEEVIKKYVKF